MFKVFQTSCFFIGPYVYENCAHWFKAQLEPCKITYKSALNCHV